MKNTPEVSANSISFPYQKRSITKKGESFMKQCVESASQMTIYNRDKSYRASRDNVKTNYDLANGIVDKSDMYKITNPFGITGLDREIQDYPLVRPRMNLLIGEEANRRFDYDCRTVNPDAVSEKEKEVKEEYIRKLSEIVFVEEYDEETTKKKLAEIEKWKKYDSQDMRERMATQILQYLWQNLKLKYVFNSGFEDALIAGEEIYRIDVVSGEPVVRRVNPLNLYVVRTNDSDIIDDADIIVEDGYHNIGYIIDNYYEELKPSEIDKLERESGGTNVPSRGVTNYTKSDPYPISGELLEVNDAGVTGHLSKTKEAPYDEDGRVRVSKVTWRSLRKVGERTTYDDAGRVEKEYVDEFYEPDAAMGEQIKWIWINEWWEGTKIGRDIFVKMGPRPIQFRRFTNKSAGSSGYVGTLYNINSTVARSLMDIMKPYQYLYDEFMDRIKSAFEKFKGPMIELDFAKMPDGWEPSKWMHYAENMGYLIVDSFKEGKKGAAQGKLAGNYNTTNKVLNPDLGNYIQHHIMMLEYIEKQIGLISGIPDQRLGEIQNRETVGGVERAVNQSSHITEPIFSKHDETRLRVLETLLETTKYAWKDDKKKMQYVLDDLSLAILEVDGELINEAEYGIFVTDGRASVELTQVMKQLAHAGMQSGTISMGAIIDIYMSPSISVMRRKIEEQEEQQRQREEEAQKAQQKAQQEAVQAQMQAAKAALEQQERESIRKAETDIAIALIKEEGAKGEGSDIMQKLELEKEKLNLQKDKQASDEDMNRKKQAETERSNKAKEAIQRSKQTISSK